VEEHPPQTEAPHRGVELGIAVAVVASDRVPEVRRVHADLVRPPGLGAHLEPGAFAGRIARDHAPCGVGLAADMRVPFHLYWRADAALLAQLPIEGGPLFDAALARCILAALATTTVAVIGAVPLALLDSEAVGWATRALQAMPIAGDPVYGRGAARGADPPRPALHAAVLGFSHPRSGARLCFEAPLPDDLARALDALEQREAAR